MTSLGALAASHGTQQGPDRWVAAGWAHFWHDTRLGRYGEQLDHLFTVFPRAQVFVLRYRDLRDAPTQTRPRPCTCALTAAAGNAP